MSTPTDPIPRPPLERGTALSTIYSTADQQRQAADSLRRAAEEHALTVHRFITAVATGEEPDPAPLLRSRGRVEALFDELSSEHEAEGAAFDELKVVLGEHADADPALEARAMAHLRVRLGRVEAATDADAPVAGPEGSE